MNSQLFHFTLGPVQGFVAQARRTRDLWAGSFLLSWLAGQAMAEVRRQGGRVVFPVVADGDTITDPLIAAIEGKPLAHDPTPQIGSLPNRFKATVPDSFDAHRVETAMRDAWRKLADAVWEQFVDRSQARGNETRAIWDRQVNGFWEISWVLGADPGDCSDARWLDARKNWRNRWPEPEGGDHCTLMGDWQELSGFVRAHEKSNQDDFWNALGSRVGRLELRENERLCAIALIKRLFPKLEPEDPKQSIRWVPDGISKAVRNWPSTAYMAAIPWLRGFAGDLERTEKLRAYEEHVIEAAGEAVRGERSMHIKSLESLKRLAWLDGNFFLPAALANASDTPLTENEEARQSLCTELKKLQKEHPVQPYYALLLLDGDNLGKHLSTGKPDAISCALARFSRNVAGCVEAHDGVTLYAGGDDVMALLPYDRALDCAMSLHEAYGTAFNDPDFTASVAVVFAHYHLPLREVLAEARRQLDGVAKDGNGRDSIALAWFKASGKAAEWVSTWADDNGEEFTKRLQSLADAVSADRFGSGFFYKLRTRYPMLADAGELENFPNVKRLLQAEYLKSRERKPTLEQAEEAIAELFSACQGFERDKDGKAGSQKALQLDGLRLARLLAGKEVHE
ncbi:MAG: type III-B CRISPR-associated protein Cas10/Cmr2 [Gammaproteobacteria bacterium]